MKAAYPVIPLGELCDVLDSKRRPITKRDRIEGEFPYYGATGILGYVEGYIFDEPLVLIGEDGAKWGVGENTAFSAEGRYWVNNHAHVIRPHRQKILDAWIIYQLNQADLSEFITGLTVPKLNQAKMREIPIIVPPIDEQQRIIAVLDKAFAGIATATANAQKNLTNARALFESYTSEAFEQLNDTATARQSLEALTDDKSGITYGVVKPGDIGSIPFVRGGDLIGGEVRLHKLRTITSAVSEQYSRTLLRGGELLMCLVGVPGQCAIAPTELAGANIARQVGLIRLKPEVNAEYVKDYLQSPVGQTALGTFTGGSVQQVINLGDLRQVEVPLPERPKQDEVVERIAVAKSLSSDLARKFEKKLAALSELKQSLLQKAFAGELT